MRILVYGAGVLGCNLAHLLYRSKQEVTLLARGRWYEEIKQNGLTINHKLRLHRTNDKIKVIDKLEQEDVYKMVIGRTDHSNESNGFIEQIFRGTKIKVTIENRMNDWLKCHMAFILPLIYATYYTQYDLRKIKKDKVFLYKIMDAMREYYDVLKDLGYEILPKGDYEFVSTKKMKCYLFLKLCCYTMLGDLAICDHAKNGANEMKALNQAFSALKQKSSIKTEKADELEKYLLGNNG